MSARQQRHVVLATGAGAVVGGLALGVDGYTILAGWCLALVPFLWVGRGR